MPYPLPVQSANPTTRKELAITPIPSSLSGVPEPGTADDLSSQPVLCLKRPWVELSIEISHILFNAMYSLDEQLAEQLWEVPKRHMLAFSEYGADFHRSCVKRHDDSVTYQWANGRCANFTFFGRILPSSEGTRQGPTGASTVCEPICLPCAVANRKQVLPVPRGQPVHDLLALGRPGWQHPAADKMYLSQVANFSQLVALETDSIRREVVRR